MIIYQNTIQGFIDDCNNNEIIAKIRFELKQKRGININVNSKEAISWNTLKEVANYLHDVKNKNEQFILLEFVIRDSTKRIDLMIVGCNEKLQKTLFIIELKSWSKIDLYKDTLLLNPHVTYGLCNHPSYEAYDYYWILKNMYSSIEEFLLYCYSFLPNYSYSNINVLKDKRFNEIINSCECYCKKDAKVFKDLINKHFKNAIEISAIEKLDQLSYQPSKSFQQHMQEECEDIRLIGSQNIAYNQITSYLLDINNTNKKYLFIISGGAGSGKTIVAFKLMVYLRYLKYRANLILPGPEFREAVTKMMGQKIASSFIVGANSRLNTDFVIIDEAHKATGQDTAEVFYQRIFKYITKCMIALIDDYQVINKKGITKETLKSIASNHGFIPIEFNLTEQFRNGGDVSYTNWLKRLIFNDNNDQEYFVNNFFDFDVLDEKTFNEKYQKMYDKYNVRLVSFWTQTWSLKGLIPTVKIGNSKYIWNPNWRWLDKYNKQGGIVTKELINLCKKQNFNLDKKGYQYIGYFNTVQGYEFEYVFVHVPKLFYLNDYGEIDFNEKELDMQEMTSQIWATNKIKDNSIKQEKMKLNKKYFLNRLFVNLTRGTKGAYVYIEDKKLNEYFKKHLKNRN